MFGRFRLRHIMEMNISQISEDLIARIVKFATKKGDWILHPFAGRGTTGIVSALLGRNFTGIDLYPENVLKAEKNISDAIKGKLTVKFQNQIEDVHKEFLPEKHI